jgi:hypothetical protein
MTDTTSPETYTLDVTGDNGTPFRFVFWPGTETVRYYDRRYTRTEGEYGYGVNHMTEDGQACGPALAITDFVPISNHGLRGYNAIDEWDIDRRTMNLVGTWLRVLTEKGL